MIELILIAYALSPFLIVLAVWMLMMAVFDCYK